MARSDAAVEILTTFLDWLRAHAGLTTSLVVASIVLLVASLWIGHYYLTTIPHDYFIRQHIAVRKTCASAGPCCGGC